MAGSKKKESEGKSYLVSMLVAIPILGLVYGGCPTEIPFSAFQFWHTTGSVGDWLSSSWPILVWGGGLTLIFSLLSTNPWEMNRDAEEHLIKETLLSIWAGVVEEISFRWLLFLSSIFWVKVFNYAFFGWLGFGLYEWFNLNLLCPLANFFTLGALQAQLFHSSGWAVGAAILSTNAFFRDGHKYLGPLGYINSWFIGMFMFWLLFQYGLLACIFIHFLYDFIIFAIRYVDRVLERNGIGAR